MRGHGSAFHPFEPGGEAQVFPHGHFIVQRRHLRQVAQMLPGLLRLQQRVVPGQQRPALGGGQIARQNIDQRGLARAVLSQQPQHRAFFHMQRHIPQSIQRAVALGHMLNIDHRNPSLGWQNGRFYHNTFPPVTCD